MADKLKLTSPHMKRERKRFILTEVRLIATVYW